MAANKAIKHEDSKAEIPFMRWYTLCIFELQR